MSFDAVRARFAEAAAYMAYRKEVEYREWLRFWSGYEWSDTPPERLLGSWVKADGDAT